MISYIVSIICIFVLLCILLYIQSLKIEGFTFNIPTRSICPTRNQSYDLRGDPLPVPRVELPVHNSEIGPLDPFLCGHRGFDII